MKIKHDYTIWTIWEVTLDQVIRGSLTKEMTFQLKPRTSPVVQWLRICLPMQGTRVRALVREDPTCHGAAKPTHHNY